MKKVSSILFILLFFSYINNISAEDHSKIEITNLWISEAPKNASVLVAYAKFKNNSTLPISLNNISSLLFSSIEIHKTIIKDDIASMERFSTLEIPPKSSVEFLPGDYHLMLFNPKKPMIIGSAPELLFTFSDGSKIYLEAKIKKRDIKNKSHHH